MTIRDGFDIEIRCAHEAAKEGRADPVGRHLAAAHALAVWGDTSLLADYDKHDKTVWKECGQWKTTTTAG